MSQTFKVGDKIRILSGGYDPEAPDGSEQIVHDIEASGINVIGNDGDICFFFNGEVELVESVAEDIIKHPSHYAHVPGVECKDVVGHFNYNKGTAIAYIWRSAHKGAEVQDLQKAITHLEFELDRLQSS